MPQKTVLRELWTVATDAAAATDLSKLPYWTWRTREESEAAILNTPGCEAKNPIRVIIVAIDPDSDYRDLQANKLLIQGALRALAAAGSPRPSRESFGNPTLFQCWIGLESITERNNAEDAWLLDELRKLAPHWFPDNAPATPEDSVNVPQ